MEPTRAGPSEIAESAARELRAGRINGPGVDRWGRWVVELVRYQTSRLRGWHSTLCPEDGAQEKRRVAGVADRADLLAVGDGNTGHQ